MRKIYSIPVKANFIEEFTNLIYSENLIDYSDICVVFPNRRPFLYLQKKLAEKIKKTFYPTKMLTIDEFINYIVEKNFPGVHFIPNLDAIYLIYKINKFKKDFLDFYPWGERIIEFLNRIDIEDIDNKKLETVEKNAEIGFDIPKRINDLLKNIVEIREKFHRELDSINALTRGYAYLKASNLIENENLDEFKKIYFGGFFALTGAERKIIKKLFYSDKAEIIWQGFFEKELFDNQKRNWEIFENLKSYFNCEIEILDSKSNLENEPEIKIYSMLDDHSQALKAFEILSKLPENSNTSIVLPTSEPLFPLLSFAIDRLNKKFNISLQYPLNKTSLFNLIEQLINCQLSCKEFNGKLHYYSKDYLNAISNPFIKNLEGMREIVHKIDKKLRNYFSDKPFLTLDEIEQNYGNEAKEFDLNFEEINLFKKFNRIFFSSFENIKTLKEASERIKDILDYILKNSEIRSYVLSGEVFNLFFETLYEIEKTEVSKEVLSKNNEDNKNIILKIILKYLGNQSIPFNTEPLQNLEIIGMLETRNLNFDNVIILNVEEEIIPGSKKVEPLIPLGIYKILGIPSVKDNEEIFKYYFERLVKSSKSVHLFYIQSDERTKSRYIEEIIWRKELEAKKLDALRVDNFFAKIDLITKRENEPIKKDKFIIEKLKGKKFSVTDIDIFLKCQIKFYYEKVLGLQPLKEISEDIEAKDRGSEIHEILKETFYPFKNKILSSDNYNQILEKLKEVIEKKLGNKASNSGERYLFKIIAEYKLQSFLKKYLKEEKKKFMIKKLEKKYEAKFGDIILEGKIDRVDYFPDDDKYLIIDYKTSGEQNNYSSEIDLEIVSKNDIEIIRENIKSFQLPVYIFLFSKNENIELNKINGALYYLKDLKEENLFDEENNNIEPEIIINDYYLKALEFVIKNILDEDKGFEIYEDVDCQYCDWKNLCKYVR